MTQTKELIQKKSNVEVKVLAINTLYKYALLTIEQEINHFKKFIGIDIFKVDGSIKQKYINPDSKVFEGKLEDGTYYHVHSWYKVGYGCFDLCVKICINGGSYDVKPTTAFCQYEEVRTTMFDLVEGSKLKETNTDRSYLQTVYNVEDLTRKAENVKNAAKVYETAQNSMPYIFRDVFYIERLTR